MAAILVVPADLAAQNISFDDDNRPDPSASVPATQSLRIVPLAGNGERNDLGRGVMAPLVVDILDQDGRPVEGADVVFRFPESGPSALFPDQRLALKVKSNADGQAAASGWVANKEYGQFKVAVSATTGTISGETWISMSNVARVEEVAPKRKSAWSSKWTKVAIVAAAGAVAVGVILATRGGSSPTVISGTPGSPTIGGPK
jgi:hypothetical protein